MERGSEPGATIECFHADLTKWNPPERAFDLVSARFFHLPEPMRSDAMRRMGDAVAPDGRLLIVGHHPQDERTASGQARHAELLYTPDDVTALFDRKHWHIAVSETRPRVVDDPDDNPIEVTDTVVLLRRIKEVGSVD